MLKTLIITRVDTTEFKVRNLTSIRVGRNGRDEGALICFNGTTRVGFIRAGLWNDWRWED